MFLRLPSNYSTICSESLLQEVAAQFRPDISRKMVIEDLISRLGIDADDPAINQPAAFRGWSQVPWASESSPPLGGSIWEGEAGPWPSSSPDNVPFLGPPRRTFKLRDADGRVQQVVGSWSTAWKKDLLLSLTLWAKRSDPLVQSWKFGRSAIKVAPYGLLNALAAKDASVVIDDDVSIVDQANCEMIRYHASALPMVFVAWPRGVNGATPADTDWSPFAGRKVIVGVGSDRASFEHALELNDELLNVGAGCIEFILSQDFMRDENTVTVDYHGGSLRGVHKNACELAIIANEKFGLSSKQSASNTLRATWKIGDVRNALNSEYILQPWLQKGTTNVIYSDPGVGKSWFASLIVYALAGGGSLLGRF